MSELAVSGTTAPGRGLARALPDERLARRAARGDERAFAAIFDRYHQRLYRYCLAIVGRPEDAQDALQNTMLKALRALPGEERRIELKPWLYRVAHNESIDLLRRRRDAPELDAELPAPGSSLAEEAETRERLGHLLADVEALPERQRGALIMRELAGLDFGEIGVALGATSAVARQTLYEARLGLREMGEGREMTCDTVTRALSDGDGRVTRRRDIRAHLRACSDCRRFHEEIEGRRHDLAALSPLPAVAAAGLLQSLLGAAAGGGGGGGLATALGGGAAKSLGGSALLKGAATVAVVAAVGVGAADRSGLVDLGAGKRQDSAPAAQKAGGSAAPESPGSAGAASGAAATAVAGAAHVDGASAAVHRGAAAAPKAAAGIAAKEHQASTETSSPGRASTPAHGRGHEKQHPAAAEHGQQTAAAHKAGGKSAAAGSHKGGTGKVLGKGGSSGKGVAKGHSGHPVKPAPPPAPPAPSPEKGKPSPAADSAPEAPEQSSPSPPLEAPSGAGEAAVGKGPENVKK
jgi:RNA polymerase sigma factor (sigma-70 family)